MEEQIENKKPKGGKGKKPKTAKKRRISFADIISGEFLIKDFILGNIPYVIFIILLGLLMVSKGYYAKQLEKDINQKGKQLDAVTADYVESKAKLEEETSRGKLIQKLDGTGLKESTNPPKVIRLEKQK